MRGQGPRPKGQGNAVKAQRRCNQHLLAPGPWSLAPWLICLIAWCHLSACKPQTTSPAPVIACTIPPQAWLVQELAGDALPVETLLDSGASPATFQPGSHTLGQAARSQLLLVSGLPIEHSPWHQALQNNLTTLDLSSGIERQPVDPTIECACCDADGLDPHIWLDPLLLRAQMLTLSRALQAYFPEHAHTVAQNTERLGRELLQLHDTLTRELAPLQGKPLLVVHPAWGYLAKRYGMQQVAIEAGGHAPSDQHLKNVTQTIEASGATLLILQSNSHPALKQITEGTLGLNTVVINELEDNPLTAIRACAAAARQMHGLPPAEESE